MVSCGLINKIKLIKMQKDLKYFRILDEQLKFVKMTMMQRKDINDALGMIEKQLTIPVVVRRSEQLVCSCGSIKVHTSGGSQCPNNRCSSAN
jgi:hypothetical protein